MIYTPTTAGQGVSCAPGGPGRLAQAGLGLFESNDLPYLWLPLSTRSERCYRHLHVA